MVDFEKLKAQLKSGYAKNVANYNEKLVLPELQEVIRILKDLRKLFYPAFFSRSEMHDDADGFIEHLSSSIYFRLKKQISLSLTCNGTESDKNAERITDGFFDKLPEIQRVLATDVQASFDGDPAAKCKEEIILSYPGFFAIFVYRIAHVLYEYGVPFLPRMMTEYAHGKTGVDINPGATIGEYFFIDHGTGIVIGETAIIGKGVKLYQGVTLGALSPRHGQTLSGVKRHPTVEDNVTVYSGASILGGETVIGEGAVIGGNAFICENVESGAKVSPKIPEHIVKK
ncbi:MAG: serine acetyltransferase [Clostridia bacterium]|nr:serine acetyltransferase [Clostridia bacterium]